MHSLTLRGIGAEIRGVRGRRVEAVEASDPYTFRVRLEEGPLLTFSASPKHPTVFLSERNSAESITEITKEAMPSLVLPFLRLLDSSLKGSRLTDARQAGLDRVLAVTFQVRDRLGDTTTRHLVAELTGSASDLVLVEGEDPWSARILGRLRSSGSNQGGRGAGAAYALPPSIKVDASTADDAELLAAVTRAVAEHGPGPKALVLAWLGMSPTVARELLSRVKDPARLEDLVTAWRDLVDATRPEGGDGYAPSAFHPTLVTRKDGTAQVHCFTPRSDPKETHLAFPTLSAALEESYLRFRAEEMARGRPAPLRSLQNALDRAERGLAAVDREEAETGAAQTLRLMGEAVLAQAHAIPRGVSEAEIPDPRSGDRIRVHLNPRLSAAENADLCFKKARKAERRVPALRERRESLRAQRDALLDLRRRLEGFVGGEPDPAWIQEAEALGVRFPRDEVAVPVKKDPESRLPASLRPRRYDLGDGWLVLVGKSNRGNDVLTLELARPDDLWMHAHQAAGSHLVLRHHEKGKAPPRPVILAAAALAAYFSKARGSSKVPVLISQKRHVRKPRNAPVGTVSVSRYETVMVEPRCPEGEERG